MWNNSAQIKKLTIVFLSIMEGKRQLSSIQRLFSIVCLFACSSKRLLCRQLQTLFIAEYCTHFKCQNSYQVADHFCVDVLTLKVFEVGGTALNQALFLAGEILFFNHNLTLLSLINHIICGNGPFNHAFNNMSRICVLCIQLECNKVNSQQMAAFSQVSRGVKRNLETWNRKS